MITNEIIHPKVTNSLRIAVFLCAILSMRCSPTSSILTEQPNAQPKVEIEFIPLAEVRELVSPQNSNLDAYLLTDGAWVKDAPILVNQEFDFGTAFGVEGIGAGIASAQRQRVSKETAELLAPASNIDLNKNFATSLDQSEQKKTLFKYYRVAVYAILFGHPKARLQRIVELHRKTDNDGSVPKKIEPLRLIHVSKELPIKGAGSWSENGAARIQNGVNKGFSLLVHRIGNLFDVDEGGDPKLLVNPSDSQPQRCHLGGNQYATGVLLDKNFMQLKGVTLTLIYCRIEDQQTGSK